MKTQGLRSWESESDTMSLREARKAAVEEAVRYLGCDIYIVPVGRGKYLVGRKELLDPTPSELSRYEKETVRFDDLCDAPRRFWVTE